MLARIYLAVLHGNSMTANKHTLTHKHREEHPLHIRFKLFELKSKAHFYRDVIEWKWVTATMYTMHSVHTLSQSVLRDLLCMVGFVNWCNSIAPFDSTSTIFRRAFIRAESSYYYLYIFLSKWHKKCIHNSEAVCYRCVFLAAFDCSISSLSVLHVSKVIP